MKSMLLNHIVDTLEEDEALIRIDGYDDCVIGVCENHSHQVLAYSIDLIIEKLMKDDGMPYEDAEEHFSYNIIGAYYGAKTPLFIHTYTYPKPPTRQDSDLRIGILM